ncbi:hypothetical protein, partial [Vibrio parahaemolyticus]|uniref:hypothetical protein n=1 Tax=Vibrio parahaemolyticus TaxID=670 RepID=UPI001C3112A0
MDRDGIQKKLPMTLKCQCNQTFALFSRAKPYRTSMALVEATRFIHQSFTDYDSIISKVCDAWNRFLDSSKRVTKMHS